MDDAGWDGELPEALRLMAQPLRWRLLRALVRSDRTVRELTELTQERQSLISYHLQALQRGGLVSKHRSTADGRDHYYAVDLSRCRTDLQASVRLLHPGLWASSDHGRPKARTRHRVLFLCTGNSARSQIAEAVTDQLSGGSVRAASAGSTPKPLHPNAVRVMRRRGIDIARKRTKHLDEFVAQPFDLVITLCDRVREVCPEFSSLPARAHWSLADPSEAGTTLRASYPAFEQTADDIEHRVSFLLDALHERRNGVDHDG